MPLSNDGRLLQILWQVTLPESCTGKRALCLQLFRPLPTLHGMLWPHWQGPSRSYIGSGLQFGSYIGNSDFATTHTAGATLRSRSSTV